MFPYGTIINSTFQKASEAHLVNVKIRYLKQTFSVFGHFWDFNVQLQISDWKVTQVLNLRDKKGTITPLVTSLSTFLK